MLKYGETITKPKQCWTLSYSDIYTEKSTAIDVVKLFKQRKRPSNKYMR